MAFGLEKSFEKATFSMKEHYGVEIGASALRKVTLEHAEKASQRQEKRPKVRRIKNEGEKQIIAETDGTMLPMVEIEEGEGDKRKRRKVYWKEARLSVGRGHGRAKSCYGVSLGSAEEVGEVWSQAVNDAGWGSNSRIHVVGDGAPWIEQQSEKQFGKQGKFLLDFFHISEYLGAVAKEEIGEKEGRSWLRKQQEMLKNNEWAEVLKTLKRFIKEENKESAANKAYRYIENRKGQLDYKGALEADLPIGSGLIESGHRHVLQARLKLAGSFWDIENAKDMAQLLVLQKNGKWEDYWQQCSIKLAA